MSRQPGDIPAPAPVSLYILRQGWELDVLFVLERYDFIYNIYNIFFFCCIFISLDELIYYIDMLMIHKCVSLGQGSLSVSEHVYLMDYPSLGYIHTHHI